METESLDILIEQQERDLLYSLEAILESSLKTRAKLSKIESEIRRVKDNIGNSVDIYIVEQYRPLPF